MTLHATDSPIAESTTWLTPLPIIRSLGEFDLDPCGFPGHETAKTLICLPENGLLKEWHGRIWLNPPYGKEASVWMQKLAKHGNGIAILFARLETQWIQPFLNKGFFQFEGRITFISTRDGFRGNAGGPSVLIPFGRNNIGKILSSDLKGRWFQ